MTYINSQDDVILLCIRNNSTRSLLDQNIDSKDSLTALTYRYKSINKSFWSRASKDSRVNIPNLRVTAPSTPRAQALAASDLIHISGLQLSVWHYSQHREEVQSLLRSANQPTFNCDLSFNQSKTRSVARAAVLGLFTNCTIVKAWLLFITHGVGVTYSNVKFLFLL